MSQSSCSVIDRAKHGVVTKVAARALGAAAFCAAFVSTGAAEARTIVVDLFGERAAGQVGQCTLREAVQAVNLNVGIQGCAAPDGQPDTILLLPGTYTVRLSAAADSLIINRPVAIEGNGFEATTVTMGANPLNGVTLFQANAGTGHVIFRGIRIHNVTNHHAIYVRPGTGAGIYNSHITSSGQESAASYGCLRNDGTLTLSGVELSRCRGWMSGALTNTGWLVMDSSSIVETQYASRNGAIANSGAGAFLYVTNSTISKNLGANHALALNNTSGATAELYGVTIVDNAHANGGNLPAISNAAGSTLKIKNTIVGRNTGTQCAGTITSLGYNYLGQTGSTCAPSPANANDKSGGSLGLTDLRRVGGVTRVMVPTSTWGNPILAHIPHEECLFTDQRGLGRKENGAYCEIGAVNRGHATIVVGNAASPGAEDVTMTQWLNDAGFDTWNEDDNNPAPNLTNPGLTVAIISTSVNDATVGTKYKNAQIGMVVNKISALDNMGMVNTNDYGVFNNAEQIAVPLNNTYFHHQIGNFPSLINNGGGGWGNPAASAEWLVYYMFNTKPCVFRYKKNAVAAGNFVMPAGRIAFPGWNTFFTGSGTQDGKEIFYQAVLWASWNR